MFITLVLSLVVVVIVARQQVGCALTQSLNDASLQHPPLLVKGLHGGLCPAMYDVYFMRVIISMDQNLKHYISITIKMITKIN